MTGGQSSKIDEHDKSSAGDTGLNDSTRQPTDLRIQCIEFLCRHVADENAAKNVMWRTPCKYVCFICWNGETEIIGNLCPTNNVLVSLIQNTLLEYIPIFKPKLSFDLTVRKCSILFLTVASGLYKCQQVRK